MMANSDRKDKKKKRNFTQWKLKFLLRRLKQERRYCLVDIFGITNAKKALDWQHVADAMNAAGQHNQQREDIKPHSLPTPHYVAQYTPSQFHKPFQASLKVFRPWNQGNAIGPSEARWCAPKTVRVWQWHKL